MLIVKGEGKRKRKGGGRKWRELERKGEVEGGREEGRQMKSLSVFLFSQCDT